MYLLYKNVPEINEGLIEVKKLARIPGERSKLLVKSGSGAENINPVGTIIGPGGSRINAIKNELSGERIDVIL
jgi:N utilization substance protein A